MIRFVPISEECEVAQDIDWKIIDPRKEIDRTLSGDIGLLEFKKKLAADISSALEMFNDGDNLGRSD